MNTTPTQHEGGECWTQHLEGFAKHEGLTCDLSLCSPRSFWQKHKGGSLSSYLDWKIALFRAGGEPNNAESYAIIYDKRDKREIGVVWGVLDESGGAEVEFRLVSGEAFAEAARVLAEETAAELAAIEADWAERRKTMQPGWMPCPCGCCLDVPDPHYNNPNPNTTGETP